MSRTIIELLDEALLHFSFATQYASQDLNNSMVIDAIALRLSAAIDALNRLPEDHKTKLFGDTWKLMYGMRNRIAHGYAVIDAEVIRLTVHDELPALLHTIKKYRAELA